MKMFGLSNVADVWGMRLASEGHVIILASDGLWDVVGAEAALSAASKIRAEGSSPAKVLTNMGLEGLAQVGSSDNVTAVVAFISSIPGN